MESQDKIYLSSPGYGWVLVQVFVFMFYLIAATELDDGVNLDQLPMLVTYILSAMFGGGLVLIFLGAGFLGRNLTAVPKPREEGVLVQKGVYRFIRHPMYSGFIFCAVSYAFLANSWVLGLLSGIVAVFFYLKARHEEQFLLQTYSDYANYRLKTRYFIPFLF